MPPATANIKVRVQARDGKILGPAATVKQPLLSVRDVKTGEVLVADVPFDHSASGTVVPVAAFTPGVSRNAIVVAPLANPGPGYPAPGPYWLQPPTDQGQLIVALPITEPSLLEFRATAFAPDPVYASATMWVMPTMQLLADPGLVLTIAGLYTTVDASVANGLATVTATVAMMCGCPVTVRPNADPQDVEQFWPSSEFEVTAQLRTAGGTEVTAFPLTASDTDLFVGTTPVERGTYEVWVTAVQASETNVGFARTKLVVS
jgi:hypothetical protein